ncbi:MAG TPA: RNA pseudouridine synthase [Planctomycetota bacterium]|nr:RNA pseudouridine synthase [Planctomycetota bacterium]
MRELLTIVYADEELLVADKPAGVLTVASETEGASLESLLAEQGMPARAVHRLDRDVSGCVLCARDPRIVPALEDLFRERKLQKIYWALAQGHVEPAKGQWKFPLLEERGMARVSARGKPSTTLYKTLARFPLATELEIELVSGRYNQIRVHAAHVGHALAGERKYARGKDDPLRAPRVALHSWRLEFEHPTSGVLVRAQAALPDDLVRLREAAVLLQRARKPRLERPGS